MVMETRERKLRRPKVETTRKKTKPRGRGHSDRKALLVPSHLYLDRTLASLSPWPRFSRWNIIIDWKTTGDESAVNRTILQKEGEGRRQQILCDSTKIINWNFFPPRFTFLFKNRPFCKRLEHRIDKWWSRQNSRLRLRKQTTLVCINTCFVSPASRQGDEKLVYKLIQLFSSTEIFSKRRKICSWWRKTRGKVDRKPRVLCWAWREEPCGKIINIIYMKRMRNVQTQKTKPRALVWNDRELNT